MKTNNQELKNNFANILEVRNISKSFGSNQANKDISFYLKKGEILSILGENGAGKSTLMSLIFGILKPDSGEIWVKGSKRHIKSAREANKLGIGMVPQHFQLVDIFNTYANVSLGIEDTKFGFIDKKSSTQKMKDILEKYNFDLNPKEKNKDLNISQKQKVEIIKLLWKNCDILILDEPTAVLSPAEIDEFLKLLKDFQKEGKSIILISHKLKEILAVSDRILVMRRGEMIASKENKNISEEELAKLMLGEVKKLSINKSPVIKGKEVIKLENITLKNHNKVLIDNISFSIREKEIVGIAAIDGNHQKELCEIIAGVIKPTSGSIIFKDKEDKDVNLLINNINKRNKLGISFITEDRHVEGLVLEDTIIENAAMKDLSKFSKLGFKNTKKMRKFSQMIISNYDVRNAQNGRATAKELSGGNQQKVIIGRELERDHRLVIAMNPTRGLDLGAIYNCYDYFIKKRNENSAILLVSSELSEVLAVSDRIIVLYNGKIMADIPNDSKIDISKIGLMMIGKTHSDANHNKTIIDDIDKVIDKINRK